MNATATPIAHPDVILLREELDDWTLLFHPLTGEAVGVDPVGFVRMKAEG